MKKNELNYKDLRVVCNPEVFTFESTENLEPINTGIGQDRGIKALEFGLNVNVKGYNLFLEGPSGVGKTKYTKNYLDKISKKKKAPLDWCYIYNFEKPNEPVCVSFPAGQGKEFKKSMENLVKDIRKDLKNTFNNEDFEKEKSLIKQDFEDKKAALMENLNKEAIKFGFFVKSSQTGIYMMPVIDGKTVEQDEFEKLDPEIKKEFEQKSTIVQEKIMDVISEIKSIERKSNEKIEEWQNNIALLTINIPINNIKSKFKRNKKLTTYFNGIRDDILKNIALFINEPKQNSNQPMQGPRPTSTRAMVKLQS